VTTGTRDTALKTVAVDAPLACARADLLPAWAAFDWLPQPLAATASTTNATGAKFILSAPSDNLITLLDFRTPFARNPDDTPLAFAAEMSR
jgi:hypothetical protein